MSWKAARSEIPQTQISRHPATPPLCTSPRVVSLLQLVGDSKNHRPRLSGHYPHYEPIGQTARSSEVNNIDGTSYSNKNVMQWLWAMTTTMLGFS
jgi:hypothetical protein